MCDLLIKSFRKHITLTDDQIEDIKKLFIERKFRKRQYMLQNGDPCRYETFILSGCVRTYQINEKGLEHILQFGIEGWWVGDLSSFSTGSPSLLNIECIEDTSVLQISRANLEKLYILFPVMERYFRIIIQNAFISFQQRVMLNIGSSAFERYLDFINKHPAIHKRIPDLYIASYLGITPQSLSRLKRNNLKKIVS